MQTLLNVAINLGLVWLLISLAILVYSIVWVRRHPRRRFTPPPPTPPTRPFVGVLYGRPSVEPTHLVRSQARKRSGFDLDQWRREQELVANQGIGSDYANITKLDEWKKAAVK